MTTPSNKDFPSGKTEYYPREDFSRGDNLLDEADAFSIEANRGKNIKNIKNDIESKDTSDDLTTFIEQTIGDEHLRIDEDFGCGFVRLKSSEAQRRQAAQDIRCSEDILIELLRNSRDAKARNIFIATYKTDDVRTLVVIDDGAGIPPQMFSRVFEPRVTSKLDTSHMDMWGLHGRGMALYSIKVNVDEAEVVASDEGNGSIFKIVSDTSVLPEKTDQSTFPHFEIQDGKHMMRGPKNLIRCAVEFALEHRGELNVYFGSPAEIASTMYQYGCSVIPASKRAFLSNQADVAIFKRLSFAADPTVLASLASDYGLEISERTARRIIDGKIGALPTLIDLLSSKLTSSAKAQAAKKSKESRLDDVDQHLLEKRTVRLSDEDAAELSARVGDVFDDIAERYFLKRGIKPVIQCKNGEIRITIATVEASADD